MPVYYYSISQKFGKFLLNVAKCQIFQICYSAVKEFLATTLNIYAELVFAI